LRILPPQFQAARDFTIEEIETLSARKTGTKKNWVHPQPIPLKNQPAEKLAAKATAADAARGFILWNQNPFTYVYPRSAPTQSDVIAGGNSIPGNIGHFRQRVSRGNGYKSSNHDQLDIAAHRKTSIQPTASSLILSPLTFFL